jgi:protein arginine kinase
LIEVANARSLGRTESDYLEDLRRTVEKLAELEARAREKWLTEARALLEDRVWTAYGQMRYARLLSLRRARELLGALRLGCLAGLLHDIDLRSIQSVWPRILDGHLEAGAGGELPDADREARRAELLREWLAGAGKDGRERMSPDER